jgi:hypothetical protein
MSSFKDVKLPLTLTLTLALTLTPNQVPGMTIKKVASTAALPDRRDGLKVWRA